MKQGCRCKVDDNLSHWQQRSLGKYVINLKYGECVQQWIIQISPAGAFRWLCSISPQALGDKFVVCFMWFELAHCEFVLKLVIWIVSMPNLVGSLCYTYLICISIFVVTWRFLDFRTRGYYQLAVNWWNNNATLHIASSHICLPHSLISHDVTLWNVLGLPWHKVDSVAQPTGQAATTAQKAMPANWLGYVA